MECQIIQLGCSLKVLNREIIHFSTIDSTNIYLLGSHSHLSGTVVLADYQTAGRGRRGRIWLSPKEESLLFSIYLREDTGKFPIYIFTFLAAVGVYEGLLPFVDRNALSLKWPNDVMIDHKKVCGILVQSKSASDNLSTIVIGVGLNVNQPPEFFSGEMANACSVLTATGNRVDRMELFASVAKAIDENLIALGKTGVQEIFSRWRRYCLYIGKTMAVTDDFHRYEGIFKNITSNGSLILMTDSGERTFHAAEVSIVKETLT